MAIITPYHEEKGGGMSTLVLNYAFYPGAEKGKITSQD